MHSSTVAILGAGPVGLATAKEFLKRGHAVRFVTRSGKPVLDGTEVRAADVHHAAW